jgi:hypothetical protein
MPSTDFLPAGDFVTGHCVASLLLETRVEAVSDVPSVAITASQENADSGII